MPSWYTERVRTNGLRSSGFSFCSSIVLRLAMRSPWEMETWVATRWEDPGLRERARLQKGVWLQVLNSSLFQDETEEIMLRERIRRRDGRCGLSLLIVQLLWWT